VKQAWQQTDKVCKPSLGGTARTGTRWLTLLLNIASFGDFPEANLALLASSSLIASDSYVLGRLLVYALPQAPAGSVVRLGREKGTHCC
jgi:hypothetical protein